MFLVQIAVGSWRPVIEFSALHQHVTVTPFKMEMVALFLRSIGKGDVMFLIDLKDAYFRFHPPALSSVPRDCSVGQNPPVHSALLWPFHNSPCLYWSVCIGVKVG